MIIVVGLRKTLRSRGYVMRPCAVCARLTRQELVAVEAQKVLYHLIPIGERGVSAELTQCSTCDVSRDVRETLGEPMSLGASDDDLRKAAPKALRVRGKRLRALYEEAVERGAVDARRELLEAVLGDLDEGWACLRDYDARTLGFFVAALVVLAVGLGVGGTLGGAWLTALAIVSGLGATGLIVAATWSAVAARPLEARKRFLPPVRKALSALPFDEDEVDAVLEAARSAGSPIAKAHVLRTRDVANRPDAASLGPYRA